MSAKFVLHLVTTFYFSYTPYMLHYPLSFDLAFSVISCFTPPLYGKYITKTYLYNFDPLKPHFYIVKLGFTGVYIIFLISAQTIDCGYSLEPPRRGGSNEYPQSMFCAEIWKLSEFFLSENIQFLEIKFSIYLNRRVFVMRNTTGAWMGWGWVHTPTLHARSCAFVKIDDRSLTIT